MSSYIENLFDLSGRVALVTGGSSGIGRHAALVLASAGVSVVVAGRNRERLSGTVEEIRSLNKKASTLSVDLQHPEEVQRAGRESAIPFGPPDILVNAAGINLREAPDDVTWKSWTETLTINLTVPFFLARALADGMRKKGAGSIINIASLQSFRAFANSVPYGASKGGIVQLTRAMAEAWSQHGIVANAIAPGFFRTELTKPVYDNPELAAANAMRTAVGRNGAMDDLDGAMVFLASGASRYVTGQVIAVDGGFLAR